jgi:hypothetical protein
MVMVNEKMVMMNEKIEMVMVNGNDEKMVRIDEMHS